MTDLTVCFALLLAIAGMASAYRWRIGIVGLGLVMLLASGQNAIAMPLIRDVAGPEFMTVAALGTSESALTEEQKALEETLKADPTGDQYKGIEYSNLSVKSQPDDQALIAAIKPLLSDDVVVAVSNGSVRLSGSVKDKAAAEKIVESVKETEGVHEVAFDLGLAK